MDKATEHTIARINWNYGRGDYHGCQQNQAGDVVAMFAKQYGMDVSKVTFPKPGFVRVRGVTRKIRAA
jgi:hypothetical protein